MLFFVVATEKWYRLLAFLFKDILVQLFDTEDLGSKLQLPRSKAFKKCVCNGNSYGTFTWQKYIESLKDIL